MKRITKEKLSIFGNTLLQAYGASEENAAIITQHLVNNELRNLESHGSMRFCEYINFMKSGKVLGSVKSQVVEKAQGVFQVDGNSGFDIVAMETAVQVLLGALKEHPIVVAGVHRVGHTGRIGAYAEELAEHDCLGIIFGGGGHKKYKSVAPFGGKKGVMSTNPIALAMPACDGIPLSADFATSASAGGKIRLAQHKGVPLPAGQILDKEGKPSTNPADFFDGGVMLPSAGPKGSGLAMINEFLCYGLLGDPLEFNWVIIAMRLGVMSNMQDYYARVSEFVKAINQTPPAQGFDAVYYPGQFEAAIVEKNSQSGIIINDNIADTMVKAAIEKGLEVPQELY